MATVEVGHLFDDALHLAASEGHAPIVELLLFYKANVNLVDRWQTTVSCDHLICCFDHLVLLPKKKKNYIIISQFTKDETIFNYGYDKICDFRNW